MTATLSFEEDASARIGALELVVSALLRELAQRDPDLRDAVLAEVRRATGAVAAPTPKTEAEQAKALDLAEIILAP
ncbi:hypothetical protein OPKNFCMD_3672 [Methylobacterium crusticola]|uniref:Uncharacterized protein n=1 Tax=Methylobacterium crusticola TaxID=1697972 RepID=A0ABQ4R016_9HYPH|nr:hypothetical protein [Methylobacterium crusticola]GJD50923.1 hypothetical protein OPKNFCMD_3672 [Methylobacterium crusticola]